jgi:hypothetical protein
MIRLLAIQNLSYKRRNQNAARWTRASRHSSTIGNVSGPEVHLAKPLAIAAGYFRAAHAYMLISMPTGTSTIFGAFQAILALLLIPDELRPHG